MPCSTFFFSSIVLHINHTRCPNFFLKLYDSLLPSINTTSNLPISMKLLQPLSSLATYLPPQASTIHINNSFICSTTELQIKQNDIHLLYIDKNIYKLLTYTQILHNIYIVYWNILYIYLHRSCFKQLMHFFVVLSATDNRWWSRWRFTINSMSHRPPSVPSSRSTCSTVHLLSARRWRRNRNQESFLQWWNCSHFVAH